MLHPLVIETGESFLDEEQVFRYIREKCGDAVGQWVEDTHVDGENMKRAGRVIKFASCVIHNALTDIASWDLEAAVEALDEVRIQ